MLLLLLAAVLAGSAHAAPDPTAYGIDESDAVDLRALVDGWQGAAKGCFDAADDATTLAMCAQEAEADDPLGYAIVALYTALSVYDVDLAAAEAWGEVAMVGLESELSESDPAYIFVLGLYGSALFGQARLVEAESVFDRLIALTRAHLPDRGADLRASLLAGARARINGQKWAEAVPYCVEALTDPSSPDVANLGGLECMSTLGGMAAQGGDWGTAKAWWAQFLTVAEGVLAADNPMIPHMKGQLGRAHLETGEFDAAIPLITAGRDAHRAAAQGPDPEGRGYDFFLARSLSGAGQLTKANLVFEEYIAWLEATYGADALHLVLPLNEQVDALQRAGRYEEAEAAALRSIAIGRPHNEHADALNRHGELLRELGRLDEALARFEELEELQTSLFGPDSPEVATPLMNGANALHGLGRFSESKLGYERALRLYEAAYGLDHPFVGTACTSLAVLLQQLGDWTRAVPLLERSVAISEATWGPQHRFTGIAVQNLAAGRWGMGEQDAAIVLFERAFQTLGAALGLDHPDVISLRANVVPLLRDMGEYASARDLARDTLARAERRFGAKNLAVADHLGRLADILFYTGERAEAARHLERAIGLIERQLGPEHPDLVHYTHELALADALLGKRKKARRGMDESLALADRVVRPLLDVTSERERLALIGSMRDHLDDRLSLFEEPSDQASNYAAVLSWKGAVRASLSAQRSAALAGDDPAVRAALDELNTVRQELASAVFGDEPDPDRIAALTAEKERRERALAQDSAGAAEPTIAPAALCGRLEADEALVDLLRYDRLVVDERGKPQTVLASYLAVVSLGGACEAPIRVELGGAEPIELAVARYRRRVASGASASALEGRAKELRGAVWDPVAAVIGERDRVWLVPDGALSSLPFGALLLDDGRFLLETHRLSTLASARDLHRETGGGVGALVAGGVVYDAPGTSVDLTQAVATRSPPRSGLDEFGFLAATEVEAAAVAEHLSALERVALVTGSDASEARIRRDAPGKRILHLATHGFFATGAVRDALGDGAGWSPMLLSGVVLAGANVGGSGPADDGILTAEEVVGLDLRGSELVVLSACETGLGEVADGEGVLGLRRAFSLAGAGSLVLSLWKVPDRETQALMDRFYGALATESPADAMRAAQLSLIEELRARGDGGHPFYWAAFVVTGR